MVCRVLVSVEAHRRVRAVIVTALIALSGHLLAGTAGAAPAPGHQDLFDQIVDVQAAIDGVAARVDLIPPAWSQTLPTASRFVAVMGGAAVLDKETGLVWDKEPDASAQGVWAAAQTHCNNERKVGNRKGWRLPTAQELASLLDPSVTTAPTLPAGHPFIGIQSFAYWSATVHADEPGAAWFVDFRDSRVFVVVKSFDQLYAWCVRGHGGTDAQ